MRCTSAQSGRAGRGEAQRALSAKLAGSSHASIQSPPCKRHNANSCVELRAEPSDEVSNIAHSMYGWIMIKTIIVRTSASSMREESASCTETL